MRYDDKYDNHFLHIECGRSRFADFATHTLNALAAPGTPAALHALGQGLAKTLQSFQADVVTRTGRDGTTQAHTKDEDDQWDDIRAFITKTDVTLVRPAYFERTDLSTLYPAKLSGLTASPKPRRLTNFEAYTQALEAAHRAGILPAAPGKAARQLLEAYRQVADEKDRGESSTSTLIEALGPQAEAVCWALWDVHCAALAQYSRQPRLAAALFDYSLLPKRKAPAKNKTA